MAVFLRKLSRLPKKVLVSRTDKVGDFILTLPVFEILHKQEISFSVLCREMVVPLLDNNPYINGIITVDQPTDKLLDEIRTGRFETLLVLVNDPVIRPLLPKLRFIPQRIGPLSSPSVFFAYTHPVIQKRSHARMNEAEYNLELLRIFGIEDTAATRPRLFLTEKEVESFKNSKLADIGLEQSAKQFIIFFQGMRGSALNWNKTNYQTLLQKILEKGIPAILTGTGLEEGESNRILFEDLSKKFPGLLFDRTNAYSLRELSILISLAKVFIGPSTGPTHIANAVGTPLISFYSPVQVQSSIRWQPYLADSVIFSPDVACGQKFKCIGDKCRDFYCMDQITPESAFQAFQELYFRN